MALASNAQAAIVHTERGLTIAGTRITLYDVMDYATTQYLPKFIRGLFNLTDKQINAALTYIETNRAAVEAEYQLVLKELKNLGSITKSKIVISLPDLPQSHLSQVWRRLRRNFKPRK